MEETDNRTRIGNELKDLIIGMLMKAGENKGLSVYEIIGILEDSKEDYLGLIRRNWNENKRKE